MPSTRRRGEEDPIATSQTTTAPFLEEFEPHETTLMAGGEEDDPITIAQAGEESFYSTDALGEEDAATASADGESPFGGF